MLFARDKNLSPLSPREYLEQVWLPKLGSRPPVLDVGVKSYTSHYRNLSGTAQYVTVDIEPEQNPDVLADILAASFVSLARMVYPEYQSVLFNGMIGFGIYRPVELAKVMESLFELLVCGGQMLVGWNEPNMNRKDVFRVIQSVGFENQEIEGTMVYEPAKNPTGHYFSHWIKPL
jgi:hypothetical protein